MTHFGTGFLVAFVGLISPGMINMTTAKTTLERGRLSGVQFASGAALIVLLQAAIAVIFAAYLVQHPQVVKYMKMAGLPVFIGLAVFFYLQAGKKQPKGKITKTHPFFAGIALASLNMLSIPYYLAACTGLEASGHLTLQKPLSFFIVAGIGAGAWSIFLLYTLLADRIMGRISFIARNINYLLSALFVILFLVLLYNITR